MADEVEEEVEESKYSGDNDGTKQQYEESAKTEDIRNSKYLENTIH